QPGELDCDRRDARYPGRGVVVGDVNLLDVAVGDHVALGGTAVAGHHHAAGIVQRDDRGAVRQLSAGSGAATCSAHWQKLRRLLAQIFREGRQVHWYGMGSGNRVGNGQLCAIRPGHCPPFWTYARTKSSAFSSRTSSISSSRSSVSSASFSRRSCPAAVLPVRSSSSPPPPPRLVCS